MKSSNIGGQAVLEGIMMKHKDIPLIAATGGPGVVTAVLSSGKRGIGAGAGNASDCHVCRLVDEFDGRQLNFKRGEPFKTDGTVKAGVGSQRSVGKFFHRFLYGFLIDPDKQSGNSAQTGESNEQNQADNKALDAGINHDHNSTNRSFSRFASIKELVWESDAKRTLNGKALCVSSRTRRRQR